MILRCRHDGCTATYEGTHTDRVALRTDARKDGWAYGVRTQKGTTVMLAIDLCPAHASDIPVDTSG